MQIRNTGDVSSTIEQLEITGSAAGDFRIVDDGCSTVTLPAAGTCTITVGFEPTAAGVRNASVSVSGSRSTSASARLIGRGRFAASLEVLPGVAAGGQVVTVSGSGFPPLATVEVVFGGSPPVPVGTDANGEFVQPWLVLSGTPQGEVMADDVAVANAYDAEPVPLIVVGNPVRPQARTVISRTTRRHVSR